MQFGCEVSRVISIKVAYYYEQEQGIYCKHSFSSLKLKQEFL